MAVFPFYKGHISKLECFKSVFGRDFILDPVGGAYCLTIFPKYQSQSE